ASSTLHDLLQKLVESERKQRLMKASLDVHALNFPARRRLDLGRLVGIREPETLRVKGKSLGWRRSGVAKLKMHIDCGVVRGTTPKQHVRVTDGV
ncbi:MAG: hypothetical protein ACE5M4_11655, partial [Anaerolineales bacterium]